MNPKQRIQELTDLIIKYNEEYYLKNTSLVSDQEYDLLFNELKELEQKYPEYALENTPTKTKGFLNNNAFKNFEITPHQFEMYSIDNSYSEKDLIDFDTRIKKLLDIKSSIEYILEWKIDGVSINLQYEKGNLIKALTRGNGVMGENVIQNIRLCGFYEQIKQIGYLESCELKGEIVLTKKAFENILEEYDNVNKQLVQLNLKPKVLPVNARNLASGLIRDFKSSEDDDDLINQIKIKAKNMLNLVLYQFQSVNSPFKYQSEILNYFQAKHIPTHSSFLLCESIQEAYEKIQEVWEKVDEQPWDCDGLVLKVNNLNFCDALGYTNRFPRWATAFKHLFVTAQTEIINIYTTVGRTGKITYNAEFEPVSLLNSTIKHASLHNHQYIVEKNINIGDVVQIEKAGGIIPQVMKVVQKNSNGIFEKQMHCPTCNSLLITYEGFVDQFCENVLCKDRIKNSLVHFCSKNAMDIFFFGETWIEDLVNAHLINNFSDIYKIVSNIDLQRQIFEIWKTKMQDQQNKNVTVEFTAWKLLPKMIEAILISKNKDLSNLIYALGIPSIGDKKSIVLANNFKSMDKIIELSKNGCLKDELKKIKDFGDILIENVVSFFENKMIVEEIINLQKYGVNTVNLSADKIVNDNYFSNKNVLITGTLSKARSHYVNLLKNVNANIYDSLTSKIDFLLVGENPGANKIEKYEKLKNKHNIKLLKEKEFLELFNQNH